jgi:hypothetical protein
MTNVNSIIDIHILYDIILRKVENNGRNRGNNKSHFLQNQKNRTSDFISA